MKLLIQCDGGCQPNPGAMYGSYSIHVDGQEVRRASRIPLGQGTCNTAEFTILVEAIKMARDIVASAGISSAQAQVDILSDSQIMVKRVSCRQTQFSEKYYARLARKYGPQAVDASKRMNELTAKVLIQLIPFGVFTITWQSRERNVENFGH